MPLSTNIRRALFDEAALISELALRSKAHWGYDSQFIEDCRSELTLTPASVADGLVYVAEHDGRVVGFYSLFRLSLTDVELSHLFVEPDFIGRGCGRLLWQHAVECAARLGCARLTIESDPSAEPFYLKVGARRAGEKASTLRPGRRLSLLSYSITTK